jgi:hypothetical protein
VPGFIIGSSNEFYIGAKNKSGHTRTMYGLPSRDKLLKMKSKDIIGLLRNIKKQLANS